MQRPSLAINAFEDADSLLDKLSATDSTSFAPPPVTAPVVVATPPVALEAAPVPAVTDAVADAVSSSTPPPVEVAASAVVDQVSASAPDLASFGDLPIVPIAVGAIAVIAAVAVMSGGGGEDKATATTTTTASAPASAPAAASSGSAADLSIPYDAAARLAYEKAGSPGDYTAFKSKYEADAVAEVKSKQKK